MTIEELEEIIKIPRSQVSRGIELPEPAMMLDMASRGNNKDRQFKYLHQMCSIHSENFATAIQIKIVAIVEGYIHNAKGESAIGVYLFCRSILELSAFIYDIKDRLKVVFDGPEENWRPKGEQFFGIIMRARYGTSNPEVSKYLKGVGVSKKHLEPFNVMHSMNKLIASKTGNDLKGKYDMLCDYVHHNLSSHHTSNSGFRVDNKGYSSFGGGFITMQDGAINRYEYPVRNKSNVAIKLTIDIVSRCLEICIDSLNEMPRTPYSESQIEKVTGSKLGFGLLPPGMYVP